MRSTQMRVFPLTLVLCAMSSAQDTTATILRDKEVVAVTAEVPNVQTSSNEIGNVVTGRELIDLPLNGRNFTQLGSLQPGVAPLTAGLAAVADRKPSARRAVYRQQGYPSASHDRGKTRRLRPPRTSHQTTHPRLHSRRH